MAARAAAFVSLLALALLVPAPAKAAEAALRGHGGPVRALATSPDGLTAMSGSFDQSAILWRIDEGTAIAVLRFHDGAVNAVAALPDGRFLAGGEDGRIAVWRGGEPKPVRIIEGHRGPIVGLAVSPDGTNIASASWDGTARLTPLGGGEARTLEGHQGNVNAVAFLPDGRLVSVGYDATLRIWPSQAAAPIIVTLPAPLNAVAAAGDGEIVIAGADGVVCVLKPDGTLRAAVDTQQPSPVTSLALSPDGARIAAATIGGAVAMIDRAQAKVSDYLIEAGPPVWALAFRPDGRELLTGGSDRLVRRWDATSGKPIGPLATADPEHGLAGLKGDRGAELFQHCAACHTLTPNAGNRAGPSLHGVFGRRIATAPGYNFSEALKKLDIVWNAETIGKLFEIGPARYTPGTKMPEQTIEDSRDREALVHFLEKATNEPD
jgi:cytochrome c